MQYSHYMLAVAMLFAITILPGTTLAEDNQQTLNSSKSNTENRFSVYKGNYNPQKFTFIAPISNDYVEMSDNSVLDRTTGLIWQKRDDGVMRNHQEASEYCQAMELDERKWRLPTRAELLSLVDYNYTAPSINTQFFPDTKSFNYWASTPYTGTPQHAWSVLFSEGNVYCFLRELDTYARCVSDNS